ncbi:MAG: sodium/solute symporter [Planctomycetes bacterium]|nr:sodium/solute symporter [Planctomycetota bacterium]
MLERIDLAIIGLYFLITVAIGLWFSRKLQGSEEFFLAGRNLTWPFIGLSLFATNISTEHFVGLASAGHHIGLVQGGYEWIASYCLLMLALVFAPQYLRHKVFTIPEFFEKRYGVEARLGLTIYFLAMIVLTKTSVAIFSGGKVISYLSGWGLQEVMWGIGLITAGYTIFGGLAAVVYTDALQAVILIGGSILLTCLGLREVGGWPALVDKLSGLGRSDLLSMVRGPEDPNLPFSGFLLGNFLIGGMFYWCMDQVNVQRVLGARNLTHARAGAIFAGFLKIIPVFILVLPGVIGFVLYPEIGTQHNNTYAVLVERLLQPGFKGLVLAALFAALMSSLSSVFNSAATLVSRDLVARFWPGIPNRLQIVIGQLGLLVVMIAGIASAPLIEKYETIWDYLQEVTGYLSVPFAVAGLSGIFVRRANRHGAMAGVITGIVVGYILFTDSHDPFLPFLRHPYLASFLHRTFLTAVLSFLALLIASLLTAPPPPEVLEGTFAFRFGREAGEGPPRHFLLDYRLWVVLLFLSVTGLWIVFR